MRFPPIAIVGHSCVFPGALNPQEYWQILLNKKTVIARDSVESREAENDRFIPESTPDSVISADQYSHCYGGYVREFDAIFDPGSHGLDSRLVSDLDPSIQWTLHAGKEAYAQAYTLNKRVGSILGNRSNPTRSLNRVAQGIWCDTFGIRSVESLNRGMSDYASALLARSLKLTGPSFCIDAACASSLYAIKLACDELHQGNVDMMIAGGVNGADSLHSHAGFSGLGTLGKSGDSYPFHDGADGILPSTGAAFISLKRLQDARSDGDQILALITGLGLSNDGSKEGVLSPSVEGQIKAMQAAYESAGISPDTVSLIECDAAGSVTGDSVELDSLEAVYRGCSDVPIGSVKSNIGHLMTAAGMAGVLKVVLAMKAGIRPPTIGSGSPSSKIKDSPFRLLTQAESWDVPWPRRAAVSAFGFDGNNAHIILEQYRQQAARLKPKPKKLTDLAIVGIGLRVANLKGPDAVSNAWLRSISQLKTNGQGIKEAKTDTIELDYSQTRLLQDEPAQIPAQQLILFAATNEAIKSTKSELDNARTSVFTGLGTITDRFRDIAPQQQPRANRVSDLTSQSTANDAMTLGSVPNAIANRLNLKYDFKGPSFTISAEELSGVEALFAARSALSNHEIDAAIVAAVDLCCEPAQAQVEVTHSPKDTHYPGDAAVSLVLKRIADARRDNDTIYAVVSNEEIHQDLTVSGDDLADIFGHSHAASGLMQVAVAALSVHHNAMPAAGKVLPVGVHNQDLKIRAHIESSSGLKRSVWLTRNKPQTPATLLSVLAPILSTYAGETREEVLTNLENNRQSSLGKSRLAIVAISSEDCNDKRQQALKFLSSDRKLKGIAILPGVYFSEEPVQGEIAFTFPSSHLIYPGMGQNLLLAYPELLKKLQLNVMSTVNINDPAELLSAEDAAAEDASIFSRLKANLFLSFVNVTFSQYILGLKPTAFIGFSAGETTALFTSGVWKGVEQYHRQMVDSSIWSHQLAGEFEVLESAWKDYPNVKRSWATWGISAPYAAVKQALATEPLVHLATINYKDSFTICGQSDACRRVVALIGKNTCVPLDYNTIHHCPEIAFFTEQWLSVNTRKVHRSDVRFYGANNPDAAYYPEQKAIREALLGQALKTIDYPKIINSAYRDGVRIFVEHGANSFCSNNINRILADKTHLAVSFYSSSKLGIQTIFDSCAQLYVAGVDIDLDALTGKSNKTSNISTRAAIKTFPANEQKGVLPDSSIPTVVVSNVNLAGPDQPVQVMQRAPDLPGVLSFRYSRPGDRTGIPGPVNGNSTAVDILNLELPDSGKVNLSIKSVFEVHRHYLNQNFNSHKKYLEVNRKILNSMSTATPVSTGAALCSEDQTAKQQLTSSFQSAPAIVSAADRVEQTLAVAAPVRNRGRQLDCKLFNNYLAENAREVFSHSSRYPEHGGGQARMPREPILLVDRVTQIKAELDSDCVGTICSETDIRPDSWYLHQGHIPPGILIEAGQAYLFLISYLNFNFNDDCRFELLGYEVTYLSYLPRAGDTLKFEHRIDSHDIDGDNHIINFRSDCYLDNQPVLAIRKGRVGFLSKRSQLTADIKPWPPAEVKSAAIDEPAPVTAKCTKTKFSRAQLEAFSKGRLDACFGDEFDLAKTHTRTPRIPGDEQRLIDRITAFSTTGGPWGLGYLKASKKIAFDDWYFVKYFKEDACLPNTLMIDMAFQGMAVYMVALGFTLRKDGWTFAPAVNRSINFSFQGQVLPSSRELTLEIFVKDVRTVDEPTVFADIRIQTDGLNALHAENVGLKLTPDYPNALRRSVTDEQRLTWSTDVANFEGIPCDEKQISDCAWGRPSEAFGRRFERFDQGRRMPRLPGEPFNFISRIKKIDGGYCDMQEGSSLISEWDVSDDCIFYQKEASPTLPFCVILEGVLQPCGWLGSYMGCPLEYDIELQFRNLKGGLQLYREILPSDASVRFHVRNTGISKTSGIIILSFAVEGFLQDEKILDSTNVSGYFSQASLSNQAGLPAAKKENKEVLKKSDYLLDFSDRPERYFAGVPRLLDSEILMLDRISGYWPQAGAKSLGQIRGEKIIDSGEWFFKAHFFQDPVQPGSLGLEAILQLLQFYMLKNEMDAELTCPRFEPLACNVPIEWRYHSQITTNQKCIQTFVEITETGSDSSGNYVIGKASLWCDGEKFYDVKKVGMRIVEGEKQTTVFNRAQLEQHAIGGFSGSTKVNPTIRVPAPPFLLFDRVTEINLAVEALEETFIKSEWRLKENEWYLHNDRLANAALLLESIGQASTLFCSLLDANNRDSNRVLRILSIEKLHFYSHLPRAGETLCCKISLNKNFSYGNMTSYFFSYECRNHVNELIAKVENALTALLPKTELRRAKGVSWSAKHFTPIANAVVSKPIVKPSSFSFAREEVYAFAKGNGFECFGAGFEALKTHSDTPRLSTGKILQVEEVSKFEPMGGPWKRGYLKATKRIDPNEWFFAAHFTNDPCMPAALIASGCFQCLCFYLAACGFTLRKDGYRFEPYIDMEFGYQGGGQVTPENSNIAYEVYVEEIVDGEETFITAYIQVTVDQKLAIFIGHLGIQLISN